MTIKISWDELTIKIYILEIQNISNFFAAEIMPMTDALIVKQKDREWLDDIDRIENEELLSRACSLKYKMLGAAINCLIETWEQQIFVHLKEERKLDILNNFNALKEAVLSEFNLDLDDDKFKELRLYRWVNNFFKHGEGGSAENHLKNTKFFDKTDEYSEIVNVLHTGKILNLELEDIKNCEKKIVEFWQIIKGKVYQNEMDEKDT